MVMSLRQTNIPPTEKSKIAEIEKVKLVRSKVKSMLIIFFGIKWIVHKKFVLAGQAVNSAYYCDVLWQLREHVQKLRPELWRQKNWLLQHKNVT
jgi:hypothetical protein